MFYTLIERGIGMGKSTLNEQIKSKQFSNLILITGEEAYLVDNYKKEVILQLCDAKDTMNFISYRDNKINEMEIIDFASTMPFFSERRVIMIENSGYFKKSPEKFIDNIKNFPDTTYIVFVEKEIDKRGKLYKEVAKVGVIGEYNTPSEKELLVWIKRGFSKEGIDIEDKAIYRLLECVGSNMNILYNEIEKLKSYVQENEIITVNHIDQISISQAENKIFEMLDMLAVRNATKTLELYKDLLLLKEPSMKVLSLIARHFNMLLDIKTATIISDDKYKMATTFKIPPFAISKYISQVKIYTKEELIEIVELCQKTDFDIKQGNLKDLIAVELLIISIIKGHH